MNPLLLISVIAGGASGIFCFNLFNVGLTAPASPGSIIAIMMMAEKHSYLGLIVGVAVAALVSFAISVPILKFMGKDTSLEDAQRQKDAMKKQAKGIAAVEELLKLIEGESEDKIVQLGTELVIRDSVKKF